MFGIFNTRRCSYVLTFFHKRLFIYLFIQFHCRPLNIVAVVCVCVLVFSAENFPDRVQHRETISERGDQTQNRHSRKRVAFVHFSLLARRNKDTGTHLLILY